MDDTRTREPGPPRPELPESLAWLYDPPPEEPALEHGAVELPEDAEHETAHDPEALPTLLPFATAADEPASSVYEGPVRGLRGAFARFEEARMDTSVVRPFAPPVPQEADGGDEPPVLDEEPQDESRDEVASEAGDARPEPPVTLLEPAPVARPRLAGLLGRPSPQEPDEPQSAAEPQEPQEPDERDEPQEPVLETAPEPEPEPEQLPQAEALPVAEPAPRPPVAHTVASPPRPDLADPALTPVWVAVRGALGGSARHAAPVLDVRGLDVSGRRALAGLLGVRSVRAATRVDLTELERVVQEIAGLPLAVAVERFLPITGRRARATRRTGPVRAGQDWLDAHPALAALPWTATWLETVRRDLVGGDTGLTDNEVVAALEILGALTSPGAAPNTPWRIRQEVAADVVGDEHALDEGSAVAALVLRGLAASVGAVVPVDGVARRRLWARFGVLADLVSTTCLAVGIAPAANEPDDRWRRAADDGLPVHLTARDLRGSADAWVPVSHAWPAVLVVASPRVLDAVADRFGGRVSVVCTDGVPGPLPLDLLARLRAGGADLRFLTDFDQAGLALGTQLAERFGATPWRMSAEVYGNSVRSDLPPLSGRPPEVPWAPELAAAMTRASRSVPVEQLLDEVLADLEADLST